MTQWRCVRYRRRAMRYLERLRGKDRRRIMEAIGALARDTGEPRPDVSKLKDRPEHRLRIGDYRVLLDMDERENEITVLSIRRRGNAYKG